VLEKGFTLNNIIYSSQTFGHIISVIYFLNSSDPIQLDKHEQYIEDTISYMQKHISRFVTLDELAALNHLSKSQLTLIFNEKTGYSPIDFFIRLKIQRSCTYLDLSAMNINEISAKIGYNDPYYFSRIFKNIMGMSPTIYRKKKKG
jgi:YesN/AraC family two-component response regulator